MSSINYALSICLLSFLFLGCAVKEQPKTNSEANATNIQISPKESKSVQSSAVDMESIDEAALFMAVVEALDGGGYERAAEYLSALYKKTAKRQYLVELARVYSILNDFEKAESLLLSAVSADENNTDAKKMLAANYIGQKEYGKAFAIAESIALKTKQKDDYDTAASIAFVINDYAAAQKYFRLSYDIKPENTTADRIAAILYAQNKSAEAGAFLETHVRMFGCSKYLCEKLAASYIEKNDRSGALETYKKLYFKLKDEKYIKQIIELSVVGSDIDGLIAFLKKSKKDEKLLFEAYKYKKDNKNAAISAMKLYKKTKDLNYLAQAAIYKFESYPEKKPHTLIKESVKELSIVTNGMQNDVYDNYLGYLLIDYDIDVSRGVELVKRALTKDPTSIFYKDSLAWGYYKQKKCVEAYEIMKTITAELKDDKTVIEHMEAIKKCVGSKSDTR